jgi:hypothetical protein
VSVETRTLKASPARARANSPSFAYVVPPHVANVDFTLDPFGCLCGCHFASGSCDPVPGARTAYTTCDVSGTVRR